MTVYTVGVILPFDGYPGGGFLRQATCLPFADREDRLVHRSDSFGGGGFGSDVVGQSGVVVVDGGLRSGSTLDDYIVQGAGLSCRNRLFSRGESLFPWNN